MKIRIGCVVLGFLSFVLSMAAQTSGSADSTAQLPRLAKFSGALKDVNGSALTGVVGVTFALYSEPSGGAPLWLETQNVQPDKNGHYTVLLGSTKPEGLPVDIFVSEQARWVGVQISGQAEQARVLLLSVPYALKAADAETVGGLPPSAFVLANSAQANRTGTKAAVAPDSTNPNVTGKGVVDFIPMWDTNRDIIDSLIFQKSGNVGVNTTVPASTLDVNGKTDLRDTLTLFPKGTDSTLAINGTPFKIDQTGKVTFTSGQTFPGTGTITGITTASGGGLSGGGTKGTLALSLSKSCAANQGLQWNGSAWVCSSVGTGTITGITTSGSSGLSGGGTSGTLNLGVANAGVTNNMLKNSSLTISAGTGLTGGGSVALGGSTSLGIDLLEVPELSTVNTFHNTNTISVDSPNPALTLANPNGQALLALSSPPGAITIYGQASATTGAGYGVKGDTESGDPGSVGVFGYANSPTGSAIGVEGFSNSSQGAGVYGSGQTGVVGVSTGGGGGGDFTGFSAPSSSSSNGTDGVLAHGGNGGGNGGTIDGRGGFFVGGCCAGLGDGVGAYSFTGYAGLFGGDLDVTGAIFASTKDFKIDHPLDPANKYLFHASVESSEMKNIYDGNVTTDGQGHATVQLPEWFEALNTDFRYQLTVIGQFAQAIVGRKIENNRFEIRTSAPNVEVSWQVTGVRQDAFAKANPLVVEQEKDARLRGFYIHPELYGAPPEKQTEWARHPQTMERIKEMRAKQQAATGAAAQPVAEPK